MILFFTLINLLLHNPLRAHELSQLDKFCLEAKDYNGCVAKHLESDTTSTKFNSSNIIWRQYGPLRINWSGWHRKDSTYITSSLNKKNKLFYIAVQCEKSLINVSSVSIDWKGWALPYKDFENKLVNDLCKST